MAKAKKIAKKKTAKKVSKKPSKVPAKKAKLKAAPKSKQKKIVAKKAKPAPKNSPKLNMGAPVSPLGARVLIKKAEAAEKTAGGLFIPSTAQEKPKEGEVIAVGPGTKSKKGHLRPLDVKVGDKVIYEKYAGLDVWFNNLEYLILSENEIIGVIS